ncbi:MAG: serine hydrolase domain-containing protein [Candidatus Hydrogenedentota bacterium]
MRMHSILLPALIVTAIGIAGCAGTSTPDLEPAAPGRSDLGAFLREQMEEGRFPGMAVSIVKKGDVVFAEGYGKANIEDDEPATPFTLFMLGSVAKPVTATAVMQLHERGELELDEDINSYLPVSVKNPQHPGTAITPRMLLTHTSSIRDEKVIYDYLYTTDSEGGDSPITLDTFLKNYLLQDGEWYDAGQSFYRHAPGEKYNHSNVGYALAGYLVQVVSGTPFNEYCREHIFEPLGMDSTAWFLRNVDEANVAMPYQFRADIGHLPYGHYGYPTYPDGQLRTSATQFGRFLAMFLNEGTLEGARVLNRESVEEMVQVQFPEVHEEAALGWWFGVVGGQRALGVDGADKGVCTSAFFMPARNVGVIVLTNGDRTAVGERAMFAIQERLIEAAKQF